MSSQTKTNNNESACDWLYYTEQWNEYRMCRKCEWTQQYTSVIKTLPEKEWTDNMKPSKVCSERNVLEEIRDEK